jgi:hypothetical protein
VPQHAIWVGSASILGISSPVTPNCGVASRRAAPRHHGNDKQEGQSSSVRGLANRLPPHGACAAREARSQLSPLLLRLSLSVSDSAHSGRLQRNLRRGQPTACTKQYGPAVEEHPDKQMDSSRNLPCPSVRPSVRKQLWELSADPTPGSVQPYCSNKARRSLHVTRIIRKFWQRQHQLETPLTHGNYIQKEVKTTINRLQS